MRRGALNTTSDASGYITVVHGAGVLPASVQLSGRNAAWEVYLTGYDTNSITVRMLGRSSGLPPTSAISGAVFDWLCVF